MAYTAPIVDASGLHIPTYSDILADLISQAKAIYGNDIYLDNDSADYQLLSVFALKISDTMQAIQLAYDNRSPVSAIGAALDGLIKLNGLARQTASYSTCYVQLSGNANTTITNGVVTDTSGYKWDLPATVTLDGNGSANVTAQCETIGAISALGNEITTITTPTAGWISVTNANAAIPGQPVEQDSALRARQSVSTTLPSQTILSGTIAAIAALPGVTRYKVYENPTNSNNANDAGVPFSGAPPHSITCVVEGDTDANVAQAIYDNRGCGCYTNGNTTVNIPDEIYETITPIGFYRPDYVPIYANVTMHNMTGYTSAIGNNIVGYISNYLNSLEIGEPLTISALYGAALQSTNLTNPTFSIHGITAGLSANNQSSNDVTVTYKEVVSGNNNNINLILV